MTPIIIAAKPDDLAEAKKLSNTACLAYLVDREGHLLRMEINTETQNSIMLINGLVTDSLTHQLLTECKHFGFSGIAAEQVENIDGLISAANSLNLTLYMPEHIAAHHSNCISLISSAVYFGNFYQHFSAAAKKWGNSNIAAILDPMQCKLILPERTYHELSGAEFSSIKNSHDNPHPFYSGQLCAHYTLTHDNSQIHAKLFDDLDSLRIKTSYLLSCNLKALFIALPDYKKLFST